MKVTIIGGGNIGNCLVGEISRLKNIDVFLYTSKPNIYSDRLTIIDSERNIKYTSGSFVATNEISRAIDDADVVICTYPSFMFSKIITEISPYVKSGAMLGFFPAYGGAEFYCDDLINKGIIVFGLQKAPYVSRTQKQGKIAGIWSRKKEIYISCIPKYKMQEVCNLMENLLLIHAFPLKNYLAATLLPGNPLLHTAGSYVYLKDYKQGDVIDHQIYYYREWTDECSEVICKMSDEMMSVCGEIPMDLSEVQSIQAYYESPTPSDLTHKFHSITSFDKLLLPMKKLEDGYIPDFTSRYFTQDIPMGLCTIKGLGMIVGVTTPVIDTVLLWYYNLTSKEYFKANGEFGKNINETNIPQLFGISNVNQLVTYYSR